MTMFYLLLLYLLLPKAHSDCTISLTNARKEKHTFTNESPECNIVTSEDYFISVSFDGGLVDNTMTSYILVKDGTSESDPGDGRYLRFSKDFKRKPKYLYRTNKLFAKASFDEAEANSSFTLIFQNIEAPIPTTTEIPTTEIDLPTTPDDTDTTLEVYIEGKEDVEYDKKDVLNSFKQAVVYMANDYCDAENIYLTENITISNVQIKLLQRCEYNWPDSETCVDIIFSVPIFVDETSKWSGYQLTRQHLEIMWMRYSSKYLKEIGLLHYRDLHVGTVMTYWIIALVLVIIVFIIILFLCTKISCINVSDGYGVRLIPAAMSKRKTSVDVDDFTPHYAQVTPPIFDSMKKEPVHRGGLNLGYVDDEIVDDVPDSAA